MNKIIKGFPIVKQNDTFSCGVCALKSVLIYYNLYVEDKMLYERLKVDKLYGTNTSEVIKFCEDFFDVNVYENIDIDFLRKKVKEGYPIITLLQAYNDNDNYKDEWECGHFVVIIGIDTMNIYVMDPSTDDSYKFLSIKDLLERWHDIDENDAVKRHNYIIQIKNTKYNEIKKLKKLE